MGRESGYYARCSSTFFLNDVEFVVSRVGIGSWFQSVADIITYDCFIVSQKYRDVRMVGTRSEFKKLIIARK